MRERFIPLDDGNMVRRRAACVLPFAAFADSSLADCIAIVSSATERLSSRQHTVSFEDDPVPHCVLLFRAASRLRHVKTAAVEKTCNCNVTRSVIACV
jgi:hypothetical protein